MKGLGVGVVLFGLVLILVGVLHDPLGDALIRPTDSAHYLAALQNKALLIHAGLAFLVAGTVAGTGAAIVAALNQRP